MRSRRFRKRIEIWQVAVAPDGFGGNPVSTETLLTKSWAEVSTFKNNNQSENNGLIDTKNALMFTFRKRDDLTYSSIDMFLKYRGQKYTISNDPTNVNMDDDFIQIIGVREPQQIPNSNG